MMEPRLPDPETPQYPADVSGFSGPSTFTPSGSPTLVGGAMPPHPRDMSIKLEPEFYTCAFVSPLQLGQQRGHYERVCGECFFTAAMLFVAAMQCITVFGMSAYLVEKDTGYIDEFKLSMALFTEGGSLMSLGTERDLCGNFNHIALEHLSSHSELEMPDGTTFKAIQDVPIFHSYKMPSGNWVFNSASGDESYIDKLLRVLHAGSWHPNSWADTVADFRVHYGTLFVIMVSILWYHVLFELRKVGKFVMVLHHFYRKGVVNGRTLTTKIDPNEGSLSIERLNANSLIVGALCVTMRFAVACMMLIWGTTLLAASWNKLSLVLNSLAIGIVFELDVIIAYAVVDHDTMEKIENLQPIVIRKATWSFSDNRQRMNWHDVVFSAFMLLGVFVGAMYVRSWQVDTHRQQLHNAAALCLFAGPTPQARQDLLAPVPGFCESLLSLTCAPNVTGIGKNRGPCLVTDQNMFKDRSIMLHADGPLFQDMNDASGNRQSMARWGAPSDDLTLSKAWVSDPDLNLFRRVCVQLYQPEVTIDNRVVDMNGGGTMFSAPFSCPREKLFQAVFGHVARDFEKWRTTFNLQGPDVVAALDNCHQHSAAKQLPDAGTPTEAPAAASSVPAVVAAKPVEVSGHPLPINTLVEAHARPANRHHSHRHHRQHRERRVHHEVSQKLLRGAP